MSLLQSIDPGSLMTALGWTLTHFIWQAALIAAVLAVALRALRDGTPDARYGACCIGLIIMMLAPLVTMITVLVLRTAPVVVSASALRPVADTSSMEAWLTALQPQFVRIWIIGVLLLQTRLLLRWFSAQRLRRRGITPGPASWQQMVDRLAEQLAIRRPVAIFESTMARVPMVIGWLRPVILVPAGLMTGLTPQQLRAVIAHELAHVRRHDYPVNLIQAVLETLLFYHPAVWWLSNRLRVEREYCCDDMAVTLGGDAIRYARTLTLLDALRGDDPQPALASTGGSLMTRIQRLLGVQKAPASRWNDWTAPIAMTFAVVTACSALALARPAETTVHPAHHDGHDMAFFGPQDEVDLVAVLREIDAQEAEFFAVLRDAGVDHKTMMMILERLGPDERVRRALSGEDRRHVRTEVRLRRLHEHLEQEVISGHMSKQEATERFNHTLHRMQGQLRPGLVDKARRHMERITQKLHEQVEAGLMTEAQAKRQLDQAHEKLKSRMLRRYGGELHDANEIEQKLHAIGTRLKADLAAGLITEEQAKRRFDAARKEIRGTQRGDPAFFPGAADRLHTLHDEIRADLDAGRITKKEAEQRIHAAAARFHEHLDRRREHRSERTDAMRHRLQKIHQQVRADLEEGLITEAEAEDLMRAARIELREEFQADMKQRPTRRSKK